ncbi:MAG: DUF3429 domain-containing protein [Rhizobiales bacterium]|nr:DUF3429 domain-containing protein [Hyphomicrobiales bacterium]
MADLADPRRIPSGALALGLAGLVPFVAIALSQWPGGPELLPFATLTSGIVYGAVILSFLGGIRWGTAIGPYGAWTQARDMAMSVLPSLAAWIAVLLPPSAGLCLLLIGFLLQALWDVIDVEDGRLPSWFGRLRMMLTAVVVISLLAMLVRRFI